MGIFENFEVYLLFRMWDCHRMEKKKISPGHLISPYGKNDILMCRNQRSTLDDPDPS